ncbi:alpha/beta fold hydrolase [Cellvibrio sp. QJXJ]|uniref:alpha/beta fold hydrolase n=1 Tax=Cellvibrio sp. QJXJ TaxID=2964606 RepID=UPI0021C4561A|nr:alpha/beta hydrolase [Cellvibrio sp. QJXJ]UUA73381.1 alpha/beta hydrolase [Cellvibrio sp. QJXJ]
MESVFAIKFSKVCINGCEIRYAYIGDNRKPVLLLLHGFTGDKLVWSRILKTLSKNFFVIAPDLIGHGDSGDPLKQDYRIASHVVYIHKFCLFLNIHSAHVSGCSMGAFIALELANSHPYFVRSLSLINPVGINKLQMEQLSNFRVRPVNPFIVSSAGEYDVLLDYMMAKPCYIPDMVKSYLASRHIKRSALIEKMFSHLMNSKTIEEYLVLDLPPTMVLLCDKDRVADMSISLNFFKKQKSAVIVISDHNGHLPMLESPKFLCKQLISFYTKIENNHQE